MNYGIIAAGEGSRLSHEGAGVPKPLVPICGVPMIERLLRIFDMCRAESVAVIVNDRSTLVRDFLEGLKPRLSFPLSIKVKSTPSSMHSFYELSDLLRGAGRFILTTVDTIFAEADFRRYVEAFENPPAEIDGMMGTTTYIDDEKPLYVATDPADYITGFLDNPEPGVGTVSAGVYGLSDPAVDVLERCMAAGVSRMRNYQRALLSEGLRLKAFDLGHVFDIDHVADIAKAERFITGTK